MNVSTNTSPAVGAQKIRCLIVDDEENAIDGIVDYLSELESFEIVDTCFSAIEATEILKQREVDLIFLDINMPRLSGMNFLASLQHRHIVILTTAHSEYALEAFRLNVADYLLKPYTFQRFFQATQKAMELYASRSQVQGESPMDVYVRQGDAFHKINCEEILYVEAMQNYLKLHFADQTLVIHQTMTTMEETLPQDYFFRIHNSYLVNVQRIDSVSGNRVFVHGKELPISKHRRANFLNSVVYRKLISK